MTAKAKTDKNIDHLILLSGGLGSFEAARRVVARFGKKNVRLWFFDTLMEDEDLYRFLEDIQKNLGITIQRFCDGRNPWEVFRDERFIGNARVDLCSKHLKRLYLEKELKIQYPNKEDVILYFGIDWSEKHRIDVMEPRWTKTGYKIDFPLTWEPWETSDDYKKNIEQLGIHIPRLYEMGFLHNNCGGACIKAGIHQWSLLYEKLPERYLWHEKKEQELRKYLGKDVAILRNRRGGYTRPMTLRFLRWRINSKSLKQELLKTDIFEDDASCSCFVNFEELKSEI